MAKIIGDKEVGELWRRYKPLKGEATATLVLSLIRKLVNEGALAIPYGWWIERVQVPLRKYGIPISGWENELPEP